MKAHGEMQQSTAQCAKSSTTVDSDISDAAISDIALTESRATTMHGSSIRLDLLFPDFCLCMYVDV
jgi:hypothetical protein